MEEGSNFGRPSSFVQNFGLLSRWFSLEEGEPVGSLKADNKALDLDCPGNLFGTLVSSLVNQDDNNYNA